MTGPTDIGSAPHYVWGDGCDGWRLMDTPGLSVIEERMPPATSEVRHRHGSSEQCFYVLSGTLTLEVEGAVHRIGRRQAITVTPPASHQARNEGTEDVRFLVVSAPSTRGDRKNP